MLCLKIVDGIDEILFSKESEQFNLFDFENVPNYAQDLINEYFSALKELIKLSPRLSLIGVSLDVLKRHNHNAEYSFGRVYFDPAHIDNDSLMHELFHHISMTQFSVDQWLEIAKKFQWKINEDGKIRDPDYTDFKYYSDSKLKIVYSDKVWVQLDHKLRPIVYKTSGQAFGCYANFSPFEAVAEIGRTMKNENLSILDYWANINSKDLLYSKVCLLLEKHRRNQLLEIMSWDMLSTMTKLEFNDDDEEISFKNKEKEYFIRPNGIYVDNEKQYLSFESLKKLSVVFGKIRAGICSDIKRMTNAVDRDANISQGILLLFIINGLEIHKIPFKVTISNYFTREVKEIEIDENMDKLTEFKYYELPYLIPIPD